MVEETNTKMKMQRLIDAADGLIPEEELSDDEKLAVQIYLKGYVDGGNAVFTHIMNDTHEKLFGDDEAVEDTAVDD